MTGILDAGALIALERGDRTAWIRLKAAERKGEAPRTHGGVIGQVWRGGARQALLATAVPAVEVLPLDEALGKAAGALVGRAGTSDVTDAALVLLADDGDDIFTSDPDDIAALASAADLHVEIVPS